MPLAFPKPWVLTVHLWACKRPCIQCRQTENLWSCPLAFGDTLMPESALRSPWLWQSFYSLLPPPQWSLQGNDLSGCLDRFLRQPNKDICPAIICSLSVQRRGFSSKNSNCIAICQRLSDRWMLCKCCLWIWGIMKNNAKYTLAP